MNMIDMIYMPYIFYFDRGCYSFSFWSNI